jgi:Ca-activated chloride channel family protein
LMVEEMSVLPGEDKEVVVAHPDLGSGILRAELDHQDDLTADNTAWLALRPTAVVSVLLVGESDSTSGYFLKRAFALDSRVELSAIEPINYAETDEYDLTVFDNCAPGELPSGNLVFISSLPPLPGLTSAGTIENPPVLAWDAEHPVMRFLNPANVGIREARKLVLPEGSRTLVSTRGGPLIADVSRGGRQILVVAFDIAESNWPLRLSFPLFIQNLVAWVPRATFAREASVATGQPITIMPMADVEYATVTLPDGSTEGVQLDPMRPVYFGATEIAGPYLVTQGDTSEQYAVSLLDRNESAITPADALSLGRAEVKAERGRVRQNRELWRWFVIAALAVLVAEWSVYSRRAWI